ncbi:ECF-type sigma factor [Planctomycetaceae bacterium SH139]
MNDVTQIIEQMRSGDLAASNRLLPIVYKELRILAASRMKGERCDHTLTPTALVHEAYLRLVETDISTDWSGKEHFFAAAAEAMRRILIEHARSKGAEKRGGGAKRLELVESWLVDSASRSELIQLDDALERLEHQDPEAATVVKLRYFVGMTNNQAAEALACSPRKADMLWAYARSWLKRDLAEE